MNDYVIITVNGIDYYCPSNMVEYITSDLINTSTNTITLYGGINDNQNASNSSYPRITLRTYSKPIYQSSYSSNSTNLNVQSVVFSSQFNSLKINTNYISIFLLGLIFIFVSFRRFK